MGTLRRREAPRDRIGGGESPQRRGQRRSRGATKRAVRCFRCAEMGHYASDCRQDHDPAFPGRRYGDDQRRTWGAGSSSELQIVPGDRDGEGPRGLGPGTSVRSWVPSGEIHPLVIQCYHCYELVSASGRPRGVPIRSTTERTEFDARRYSGGVLADSTNIGRMTHHDDRSESRRQYVLRAS